MQSALNHVCGNQITSNAAYAPNGATITLLKDFDAGTGSNPKGYAFVIGRPLGTEKDYATKVTIDLNNHSYLFATSLTNSTTAGVSKSKAIQTQPGADGTVVTDVTFKNGTMGIAQGASASFERFMKSYVNLTLENFVLDGKSFNYDNIEKDYDGSLINASIGKITVLGDTKITDVADGYYALGGKIDNNSTYKTGFNIAVASGTIDNIALYDQKVSWNAENGLDKIALSINGGNVGEVALTEEIVNVGIMDKITIDSGATVGTVNDNTGFLAYSEIGAANSIYDSRSDSVTGGILFSAGIAGWNKGVNSAYDYNFIAASVGADATLKAGQVIIGVKDVTTSANLGYDSANSVIAVPTVAAVTWGGSSETNKNYAVVSMNYNSTSSPNRVTFSAASIGSALDHVNIVEKANATAAGLLTESVVTIDASAVGVAASIVGNGLDNVIYGGTSTNSLTGGSGKDTFYYSGKGKDVITDYVVGVDKVVLTEEFTPTGTEISTTAEGLVLTFDTNKTLTFTGHGNLAGAGTNGIEVESGKKSYFYNNYSVSDFTNGNANGITLASSYAPTDNKYTAINPFATIDASAVTSTAKLDITGAGVNVANYIVAASAGGALDGNSGNDTLVGGKGDDIFVFNSGKVVINEYGASGEDKVSMNSSAVTGVKASGNKLIFSTNNSSNTLTINPVNNKAVTAVSLTSGEVLGKAGSSKDGLLTLFQDAKGSIEAATYEATAGIDASKVKSHNVTLVGATGGGTYTFADNKKADVFQYSGGTVTVKGYESGRDKINLDDFEMTEFTVGGDNNVTLTANDTGNTIVIEGAKGKEINFRDGNSKGSAYTSMVLADSGVVYDKEDNPTRATLLSGVANNAYTAVNDKTIKKVYVDSGLKEAVSITANNEKMTVDASDAVVNVSIIGGDGDNKVTLGSGADVYEYKKGKDIVSGFSAGDSISLGTYTDSLLSAKKITVGKSDVTFKFDSSNSLNVKGVTDGKVQFVDKSMTFANNAIIDSDAKRASLTAGFTGSYKTDSSSTYVDGTNVEKSLTFKGTSSAETLTGGKKKTTFRGGGGEDNLVGGSGKDTFFYAKGDSGTATIADFDFSNDKIKIANGTITEIAKDGNSVKFTMNNGKGTSNRGSFLLSGSATYNNTGAKTTATINPDNIVIKANNTYYWFAKEATTDVNGNAVAIGALITSDKKVSTSAIGDYKVVDLSYSTNLAKAGVAYKVEGATISGTTQQLQS